MNTIRLNRLLAYGAALLTLLSGCAGHDEPQLPADDGDRSGVYLALRLSIPTESRDGNLPLGGEEGNGRDPGIRNENKITTVRLFFYQGGAEGVNAAGTTPIEHTVTFSDENIISGQLYKVPMGKWYKPAEGTCVLCICNGGMTGDGVTTLGDLRDQLVANPWGVCYDIPDACRFVMTTADETAPYTSRVRYADGTTTYTGTWDNPYRLDIEVERVAARLDLLFNQSQVSGNELQYTVSNGIGDAGTLYLTHVVPVNVSKESTWFCKRVTTDFSTCTYLGDETIDADHRPTNYVWEPHTTEKSSLPTGYTSWFTNPAEGFAFTDANALSHWLGHSGLIQTFATPELDCDRYMPLTYANENTHQLTYDPRTVTGLAIAAVYVPQTVYSDADATTTYAYTRGEDFWRYSTTTGEDLHATSTAICFSNEAAAEAYRAAHVAEGGIVTKFTLGKCYYNVWARHGNLTDAEIGDGGATWPLEFGIVRNNIYRIALSFTGPGTPEPVLRDPHNVRPRIYVRPWRQVTLEEIVT